jgi:ABC-type multidrug transport system fused ATPase/permease subunit
MGEGKIIEEGTREELLAHDGIYARMVKIKRSTEIHGFKSEEVT